MSDYQLISADAHMDLMQLPPDIFASRVEAEWRQRVPSVEETQEGERWWLLDGKKISRSGFYGPGVTGGDRGDVLAREGFTSGATRPSDPKLRREDCLRDGVDAEVMYGIIGMYRYTEDSALVSRLFHAYNDWLVDFCANDPQRFKGLGCLPSDDVEGAVLELRHVADLGLGGALIAPYHAAMPMWHEMWEPLWETAVETGVPVHFHTFGGASGGGTSSVGYVINGVENAASAGAYTCVAPLQLDEVMTSMLLCGALERHPDLQVVLGESGLGWIAYLLERTDLTYADRLTGLGLQMKPSDYFKRQMHATFLKDPMGVRLMAEISPHNVMWGNDYPHRDGTWPDSQTAIEQQFVGISPGIKQRFLCGNAAALYEF